jgi:antitoxin component of MazEF toxin-antitoxin module
MIKSLQIIGNSRGVILPSAFLKLIRFNRDKDKFYLSCDGEQIVIKKVKQGGSNNV